MLCSVELDLVLAGYSLKELGDDLLPDVLVPLELPLRLVVAVDEQLVDALEHVLPQREPKIANAQRTLCRSAASSSRSPSAISERPS